MLPTFKTVSSPSASHNIDFKNKKVAITGGLGFIGSNLAIKLLEKGAHVTLIDSLVPEYGGNLLNIKGYEDKLRTNICDVRDIHGMRWLLRDEDFLFNLAGQTSHMDSMKDPFTDLDINCHSQLKILECCREVNPDICVVFASTRQIYGKPDYLPVDENHPLRPVDVNGINKLAGEQYHILYNNVYGIQASVLRLTNTIGPRMRIKDARQTFVGIWIRNLLEGKPVEVWGGTQLRDFTYVDDCVEALLLAASPIAGGKIYNLGGNEVISLEDLAKILIPLADAGEYVVRSFPEDRKKIDIGDYYSDYAKIKNELGWQPKVDITEALKRTLDYFQPIWKEYCI